MRSQGFISRPTQWPNLVGFISGHLRSKPFVDTGDQNFVKSNESNGPGTYCCLVSNLLNLSKSTLDHFGHHFETFPQVLLEN